MRKTQGVALMTVLSVAFLLTILTGALVGNHQANFQVMGGSTHQRQSLLAAYSGLDFAKMMLERDDTWGTDGAGKPKPTSYLFQTSARTDWGDLHVTQTAGTNKVKGVFDGPNPKGFEIEVENYLAGGGKAAAEIRPDYAVRLKITGYSATFQTRIETTMTRAPLYDSAASSNGAMNMGEVSTWLIGSRDKLRNWIRSNADVNIPDLLIKRPDGSSFPGGNAAKAMRFLTSADGDPAFCDNPGVAWTKKDIYLGKDYARKVDDPKVGPLLNKTNGMMARRSNLNYNIYDLKISDLQAPDGDASIRAGTYTLIDVPIQYEDKIVDEDNHNEVLWSSGKRTHIAKALKYTPPSGPPVINMLKTSDFPIPSVNDLSRGDRHLVRGRGDDWDDDDHWHDLDRVREVEPLPDGSRLQTEDTYKISDNGEMTYHFSTRQITVTNEKRLVVDGPLKIDSDTNNLPPHVVFVKEGDRTNPAFIESRNNGNIEFQGTVTSLSAKGAVASTGNLTLGANSNVSSDEDAGVVLWSQGDVTFNAASRSSDMHFRGLVYAKGNVELEVTGGSAEDNKIQNLNIEGALVAQTGSIKMVADKVRMIYDPKYLEKLTKGLPNQKCRLGQVSFRIY